MIPEYQFNKNKATHTTDDEIDDDADEDDFNDTHGKLLGRSCRATPSLDLDSDLLFGAVESNVDLHRTPLLSPLSPPLSPRLSSSFCCCSLGPSRCIVHPFALMIPTRRPRYARLSTLQPGMPCMFEVVSTFRYTVLGKKPSTRSFVSFPKAYLQLGVRLKSEIEP